MIEGRGHHRWPRFFLVRPTGSSLDRHPEARVRLHAPRRMYAPNPVAASFEGRATAGQNQIKRRGQRGHLRMTGQRLKRIGAMFACSKSNRALIWTPFPCTTKPGLFRFCNRIHILFALGCYNFRTVILLIKWKVINPFAVARDIAFN